MGRSCQRILVASRGPSVGPNSWAMSLLDRSRCLVVTWGAARVLSRPFCARRDVLDSWKTRGRIAQSSSDRPHCPLAAGGFGPGVGNSPIRRRDAGLKRVVHYSTSFIPLEGSIPQALHQAMNSKGSIRRSPTSHLWTKLGGFFSFNAKFR